MASWNDGAERILGYAGPEAVGKTGAIIFTPEDREAGEPQKELGIALESGRAEDERWHVRKDGSRFWASGILTTLRDADGTPRGFVKALRDLTERKRMDDQLRQQAEALRLADRRKDEFLAMLSHELRNPLAPILNAVFVLNEQFPTEDAVILQARNTIERQVTNLKRLIDDLLDVSRVATHKLHLQVRPVAVGEAVDHAVENVRSLIAGRRHELTVSLDATRDVRLEADPTRLEQILTNLLTNAAKYTEPGGSIWLTSRLEGEQVVIRVRDTGIGLASDLLPRVFELFTQADTSLARTQDGLGIGLALTRSLVEMHGGTIEAHSAGPGRGSEFTFRLPIRRGEAGDPAERPEAPKTLRRPLRLLIVEDNEDAARTLALLLGRTGHEVHVAHDGPTALAMARERTPQVALLDIGLPGMNGYEVAKALREQQPDLLLIAMTGYAEGEAAREAGFDRYLVKPVSPGDLLRLLDDLGSRVRG